jgi:hypothetical protein
MWIGFVSSIMIFIASYMNYGKIVPGLSFRSWELNYDWKNLVEYNHPCISFSVSHDTTCNDICIFCRDHLGHHAFYFTDNVCLRKGNGGMCHGTPIPSTNYTCCIE